MICLFSSLIIITYVILFAILNVLKVKNNKGVLKIAFFHPFWYSVFYHIATMVEEGKKFYGVWFKRF